MNSMLNYDMARITCDTNLRSAERAHALGGGNLRHQRRFGLRRSTRTPR